MEKLVHEYLNSMVGDNPILMRLKEMDPSWSDSSPVVNFYVNDVRVGSIRNYSGDKVLIESDLRNSIMKLFNLGMEDSYLYFRKWINKLEVEDGVVRISPGPDSLRSR
jgi:hypothetical protein